MENARRTSEHLSRVEQRRSDLRDLCVEHCPADRAITLEIGCGHGHFLTAYASAHPDQVCFGLDVIAERIERAERKRSRAKLTNLRFIHASAEDFLAVLPASVRFDAVFILFPDPWPKRRHHKNRIMQSEFLNGLAEFVLPSARLYFRTDDSLYYQSALAVLADHPRWRVIDETWPFEYETVFQQRALEYRSLIAGLKGFIPSSP